MSPLRIVHFTNNDFDGAGRGVLRLHRGLVEAGVDSIVIVQDKETRTPGVFAVSEYRFLTERSGAGVTEILIRKFGRLFTMLRKIRHVLLRNLKIIRWRPLSLFNFNIAPLPYPLVRRCVRGADMVVFHSVQDMITSASIATLHLDSSVTIVICPWDMEPMTGGCHFNFGCRKFSENCGNCPQLGNAGEHDISRKTLETKIANYKDISLQVVATNGFVFRRISRSSVFRSRPTTLIYMGVEPEMYRNVKKVEARHRLGLPTDGKIVLFGCFNLGDERKGAHLLKDALRSYLDLPKSELDVFGPIRLVTFGSLSGFSFDDVDLQWTHLGHLNGSGHLNLVYRAADLLVSPSMDDLGPVILEEGFMNRLPIVAFDLGIATDLVLEAVNGYRVPCFDVETFGKSIHHALLIDMDEAWRKNPKLQELWNQCTLEYEAQAFRGLIGDTRGESLERQSTDLMVNK